MASIESKKHIFDSIEKENLNEGCKDLDKIYQVLVKLKKPGLRKEENFLIINKNEKNPLIIKAVFTTFFNGKFCVKQEYDVAIYDLESNSVLEEDTPYSVAVLEYVANYLKKLHKNNPDKITSRVCNVCNKLSQTCKKCACRTIYYCSTDCQKADWKRHKNECKPLK